MAEQPERRKARWIVVTLVAALSMIAFHGLPADAAKKKKKKVEKVERSEDRQYVGATGFRGVQDSPCPNEPVGCAVFPVEEGEKFVSLEIVDAAGQPVWASVYVYGYTDGTDAHEHVCSTTAGPLALADGLDQLVVVTTQTTGGATSSCTGPATQGTISATFSNIP